MQLPVIFSQRDKQWSGELLGNAKGVFFGDYGCLVDAYAIVLRYWGVDTDPKRLNELVRKNNGTDATGALYWNVMTKIFPDYTQKIVDARDRALTDAELKEVTDAIKNGVPVIIQVDMVPATSKADMHFVVGYEFKDNEINIGDPWTGQKYALRSKYGSAWTLKRAIYRYVIFQPKEKPKPAAITRDEEALKEAKKYPMLQKWAEAIRKHEGWFDGSVSQRCNNAGNIRLTDYTKKYLGAVGICPTANFAYFRTAEEGMEGLLIHLYYAATSQLKNYKGDMTLLEFYNSYAPSADGNSPKNYATAVAKDLGVTIDTKIKSFLTLDAPKTPEVPTTPKAEEKPATGQNQSTGCALDGTVKELKAQIESLNAALGGKNVKIEELQKQIDDETKKRKQAEADRDAAQKTGEKYKQAIADISDRIGKI